MPDDVSWNDYRRAAAISVRRLKRWKRQNARRVAKGLPTVPWPYHNKPFPAWDDPALNIETWAPRAGKLERVA